ncbi:ATP synthase F1 subunit gamma [Pseudenhygromyxa sp. WMMC2535]|uniref:ATP synthase F1 subunit gamma n=1 Tax=Pseudenhygromyxa sp. WMMC2535 TaxID=2712867 RepID=UPI00155494F9|nr:ATP synthase F1 subunit gamma [Pseudenhygromyxa sp. WMMC2535]NVB40105.1 ATP synthase F1 subunit gamma [Pseudenhygromyxa sp. WMMC2535]
MANLKEIRNRIGAVKNTRKITSAMSRIAAARLRRAQNAMEAAREYGTRMAGIVGEILNEFEEPEDLHPLLSKGSRSAVAVVIVTADRGLCGGFNSAVNREAERTIKALLEQEREVEIITVGRKGRDYLKTYKVKSLSHHAAPGKPDEIVDIAKAVAAEVQALFQGHWELVDVDGDGIGDVPSDHHVGEVRIIFNYFRNVITQEVFNDILLPVPVPAPIDADGDGIPDPARPAVSHAIRAFEPDTTALLDHLLPVAVETAIQQALYNSVAAEVAARRSAMDSATDNASELIGELTLQYNRERQAAITTELMEIIGGSEALKG